MLDAPFRNGCQLREVRNAYGLSILTPPFPDGSHEARANTSSVASGSKQDADSFLCSMATDVNVSSPGFVQLWYKTSLSSELVFWQASLCSRAFSFNISYC